MEFILLYLGHLKRDLSRKNLASKDSRRPLEDYFAISKFAFNLAIKGNQTTTSKTASSVAKEDDRGEKGIHVKLIES